MTVPPSITGARNNYAVIRNNSVTLSIDVQKGLPPVQPSDIQWFFDDGLNGEVELTGISNKHTFSSDKAMLTINNAQIENRGIYKVISENLVGVSNLFKIKLDVYSRFC